MIPTLMRRGLRCLLVFGGVVLLTVCGCGGPKLGSVTGKVMFEDGRPVTSGEVIFQPVDDPNIPNALGYIQPDGTFTMFTYKKGDGVHLGRFHVLVQPLPDDFTPQNPRPIDARFNNPKTSGFEIFEVKPGKNTLDLTVHPPRRGGPQPGR